MAEEHGSLVDALDELPDRPEWQERFSPAARIRLVLMARELRTLRAHAGQPLPDLISEIERRTGLDVEVASRAGAAGAFAARADLDAFQDAAARFAGDAEDLRSARSSPTSKRPTRRRTAWTPGASATATPSS